MEITKAAGKFNSYKIDLSYGELVSLENALQDNHSGPIADELWAGIKWYLDKLPLPGEEKEKEGKDEEKGEEMGGEPMGELAIEMPPDAPSAIDPEMDVDELLPAAGDEEATGDELEDEPGEIEFEIEEPAGQLESEENGYICYYKGKRHECRAATTYEAQKKAVKHFGAKKSHEVTVKLAEKGGKPYNAMKRD